MADFLQIITGLKAKYVVLIENDLHYETNGDIILAKYCQLSDFQRNRLINTLTALEKKETVALIEEFRTGFEKLNHVDELKVTLVPDEIAEYLKAVDGTALLTEAVSKNLALVTTETNVNEAFLRNGIYKLGDTRYDVLLEEFAKVPGLEMTFYKSKPVPADMPSFTEEIKHGLSQTGSNYYIAVVDKMLGEGQEESGKAFIEQDLLVNNKTHGLKSLAFLFTTQANPTHPETYKSYFVREVLKGNENLIQIIAGYLTDSAYATVFKSFHDDYVASAGSALAMALKNQQNVKHVIKKSINEGISPFDSLKAWFDQIVQHHIDLRQIESIDYYSSLTKFFDQQSLLDHEGLKDFGPDLEKLNSFELFDSYINEKGLPIYPGDIFLKENEYYILTGQVCDLLIRDSGNRGAKIAEFLKVNFKPYPDKDEEKFKVEVDKSGKKAIRIHHFYDELTQSYGIAEIEITSKNTFYGDFAVLDLCHFNSSGVSQLLIDDFDEYKKYHWMTDEKLKYLVTSRDYLLGQKDNLVNSKGILELNGNVFNAGNLVEAEGKLIFGFKRVSRLKGRFYDSLYQQVINYKARIDLNLIDQAIATDIPTKLTIKFRASSEEQVINTTLNRVKGQKHFIEIEDILTKADERYKSALAHYSSFSVDPKSKEYQLTVDENNSSSTLELELLYTDKDMANKVLGESVGFSRLFKEKLENRQYHFIDNQEVGELNEAGTISLANLQRGIKLTQNNTTLTISNGRLQATTE
ncbi:MAG TPA: hypothetical protein VIM89_11845 [Mucilaginibacter sp.]